MGDPAVGWGARSEDCTMSGLTGGWVARSKEALRCPTSGWGARSEDGDIELAVGWDARGKDDKLLSE